MECIAKNNAAGEVTDCAHCGSENYDTGCIPALVQHGKPTNCIPKEFTPEEAYWACKSVSSNQQQCNMIHPDNMLPYQKNECGDDYYCAYDESDSCSYNKCDLNDYYSYGKQTICKCEPVPHENLPDGIGRECKNKNCTDYLPFRKAPELLNDPQLRKFYNGYASWMDVPNINSLKAAEILAAQVI